MRKRGELRAAEVRNGVDSEASTRNCEAKREGKEDRRAGSRRIETGVADGGR